MPCVPRPGASVVTDVTVTVLDPASELRPHGLTGAFLAGYRNANTRAAYLQSCPTGPRGAPPTGSTRSPSSAPTSSCTCHRSNARSARSTPPATACRCSPRATAGSCRRPGRHLPHRRGPPAVAGQGPMPDPAHPPRARGLTQHHRDRRRPHLRDGVSAAAQRATSLGGLRHRPTGDSAPAAPRHLRHRPAQRRLRVEAPGVFTWLRSDALESALRHPAKHPQPSLTSSRPPSSTVARSGRVASRPVAVARAP